MATTSTAADLMCSTRVRNPRRLRADLPETSRSTRTSTSAHDFTAGSAKHASRWTWGLTVRWKSRCRLCRTYTTAFLPIEIASSGSKLADTLQRDERGAPASEPKLRRLRLRYGGSCILCGAELTKGTEALYHPETRTVRCIVCDPASTEPPAEVVGGSAGASAHREYERRRAAREVRVK